MTPPPVYRVRRGKIVEVPPEWVGRMTTRKTIRQRPSKLRRKLRKAARHGTRRSLAAARELLNRHELLEDARGD